MLLALAAWLLLPACTSAPTTAENSAPITFCRASVPSNLSAKLESLTSPRQVYRYINGEPVDDFHAHPVFGPARYEPLKGMISQIGIESLTPADKGHLEAEYPTLVPQLIKYPPLLPDLLTELQADMDGKATVYLVVSRNGNVSDVYLADCTNRRVAQAAAFLLKSAHFAETEQSGLVKFQYDESSAPVAFCHASVPPELSELYERMQQRPPTHRDKEAALEFASMQVIIDPLSPAAKDQLEAKYRSQLERPRLALGAIGFAPINGDATGYLLVDSDGNVSDVFLADSTDEHFAQTMALCLKSWRFEKQAGTGLVKVNCHSESGNATGKIAP